MQDKWYEITLEVDSPDEKSFWENAVAILSALQHSQGERSNFVVSSKLDPDGRRISIRFIPANSAEERAYLSLGPLFERGLSAIDRYATELATRYEKNVSE
ncbi:MAG: hypothetical protein HYR52_01275 [Candidatus Tectomicrobia bacterium]|uniref:Uncharacterized protein n=1 Tax=Tectimicrobiota bacterium TaxID=2528274 RepID=A0A932ZVP2_UNCTE|nr:hypothetical protein [Candidatus Tectomicrobia bacterium]MBI2177589.1 hypothetical protein [Candidatus Tectomicrobia bacterium]MBI4251420.1 hypothetical protein [Candidatus Tectomicrobia bacterium]